jgi:hypothetical protein
MLDIRKKHDKMNKAQLRLATGISTSTLVRMLVRCDADGKFYLYDLVRTKKETSKPFEH